MTDIDLLIESDGLFRTTFFDGTSFTYRLLTLKEYKVFSTLVATRATSVHILHEKIFERCYVGSLEAIPGHLPAGYTQSIGELILWLSGGSEKETAIEDIAAARNSYPADSLQEYMKRVILIAFAAYKPEEIDSWTRRDLIKSFVLAEAVLINKIPGYQPMDLDSISLDGKRSKKELINFKKENAQLKSQLGDHGSRHDVSIFELSRREATTNRIMEREQLSMEQAKKLDRAFNGR